jgi:hypothetical protein
MSVLMVLMFLGVSWTDTAVMVFGNEDLVFFFGLL